MRGDGSTDTLTEDSDLSYRARRRAPPDRFQRQLQRPRHPRIFRDQAAQSQDRSGARLIVKENLYRWTNWEITAASDKWEKQVIERFTFPWTYRPAARRR